MIRKFPKISIETDTILFKLLMLCFKGLLIQSSNKKVYKIILMMKKLEYLICNSILRF